MSDKHDTATTKRRWPRLVLAGAVAVLVTSLVSLVSCGIGGVVGLIRGERDAYHRQYLREKNLIAPVLTNPAFGNIEIREYSGGGAYLDGVVAEEHDRGELRNQLARVLGEDKAKELLQGVGLQQELESPVKLPNSPAPAPNTPER